MAAPHIVELTEVSWGGKIHRVSNYTLDVIKGETFENIDQVPLQQRNEPVPGIVFAEMGFQTDLAGSGTAGTPPEIDALLQACGMKYANDPGTSDTYSITGALKTDFTAVDLEEYVGDAVLQKCSGAAGDLVLEFLPAEKASASWIFAGTYSMPTEESCSDALATSADPYPCKALTCSLNAGSVGEVTYVTKRLAINLGNVNNSPRRDLAATDGVQAPVITTQNPTFNIVIEYPDYPDDNFYTNWLNRTDIDLSLVLGVIAGNIITISVTGYQRRIPLVAEVDGIMTVDLDLRMGWGPADTKLQIVLT